MVYIYDDDDDGLLYTNIYIYIQSTPDKSDSQVTGKSVRLSEMSDLSEIKNIM